MPSNKTHGIVGLAIWLAFVIFYLSGHGGFTLVSFQSNLTFIALSFLVALIGFVIPDIDTSSSKAGKVVQLVIFLSALWFGFSHFWNGVWILEGVMPAAINGVIFAGGIFIIFMFLRPAHRGITHSLRGCLSYSIAVFLWLFLQGSMNNAVFFAVLAFASYFSHLVLDGEFKF